MADRSTIRLLTVLFSVLSCSTADADSWSFRKGLAKTTTTFGAVRFVYNVDARKDQVYPPMWIDMYAGRVLLARVQGICVSGIYGSDDRRTFIVASNCGFAPLVAVVLDSSGIVLTLVYHSDVLPYCSESVTIDRTWYNQESPDVQFKRHDTGALSASIRGCNGDRLELLGGSP
jgi:hypothetical protein